MGSGAVFREDVMIKKIYLRDMVACKIFSPPRVGLTLPTKTGCNTIIDNAYSNVIRSTDPLYMTFKFIN